MLKNKVIWTFCTEIEKLALYANGQNINNTIILDAIGDNSELNLNELIDSLGVEKQSHMNFLYEKIQYLGLNFIIILRALNKHTRTLLEANSNNIKNAKDINPKIHFSRHKKINKQLNKLNNDQLRRYLVDMYDLEISCKLNHNIHELLIKKFLLNHSNY